jgi:hypothetical protein
VVDRHREVREPLPGVRPRSVEIHLARGGAARQETTDDDHASLERRCSDLRPCDRQRGALDPAATTDQKG